MYSTTVIMTALSSVIYLDLKHFFAFFSIHLLLHIVSGWIHCISNSWLY